MQKRTKSFAGTRPVFTGAPSLEIGGYTLDKTNQTFNVGDVIPAGTMIIPDESTKKVLVVKTAKVKSIDSNNTKKVTLVSDDFVTPIFAVGDHVAKAAGGNYADAPTIAAIEDGDNGYIVTLSAAIDGLAANDIIEEVVKDSNNKAAFRVGTAISTSHVEVTQDEVSIGVCKDTMQYSVYERRIPPVRSALKTGDLLTANVHIRFTQSK